MNLRVDARNPLGQLVGSLIVVGPGVSSLENELRSALRSPGNLHDDAPEIAVRTPVRTDITRGIVAQIVRQMCDRKHLKPTRGRVAVSRLSLDRLRRCPSDVLRARAGGSMARDTHRRNSALAGQS